MSIDAIAGQAAIDQRPPVTAADPPAPSVPASQSPAPVADSRSAQAPRSGIPAKSVDLGPPPRKDGLPRHFWKVAAGYHENWYGKSDIRLVQPGYGTDVTMHGIEAKQRTSFEYLYNWPAGYPQIDEPQSTIKVAYGDRQTGWGAEVGLDHHKYVVQGWDKHPIHITGMMAGQAVDKDMRQEDMGWRYQHTNGLNRISAKVVKSFKLPAPRGDELHWNVKLGPDAYLLYTTSDLYDHHGGIGAEHKEGPYHLGGYGATLENAIEFSRRGKWSLEFFHGLHYANLPDVLIANGHAEQSFWFNQAGFTLGRKINVPDKHARPAAD